MADPGSLGGVAVDREGHIYVANSLRNRVTKLSPTMQPIAQWGSEGSGPGSLNLSGGNVAVDSHGHLYVADGNNRIQKLSPSGDLLAQWGTPGGGEGPGQFRSPGGVALDADGNLYVADTGNRRILKLSSSGT
jgi:DNA-binding beta-propeller fold protein YncE